MNINKALKSFLLNESLVGESGSSAIRNVLLDGRPSMIARFGSVEIKGVLYPRMPALVRSAFRGRVLGPMGINAGFFPATDSMVARFSDMMFEDMKLLDILGSWRFEERFVRRHFPQAELVELKCLEPYFSLNPWSAVLEGKRVLVVHPFNTTIERQYHERRENLFADKQVLPKFRSLETVKAVQSIAGTPSEFADWFHALESMKAAIDEKDYDIAILGCGAYGFPLAAHVKRNGKIAIHLGGATQILFGIRGKRWDRHPVISKFYNEYWVRPGAEDVPSGAQKVEGGCYW